MFIGALALVALLTDENDAREMLARMQSKPKRLSSAAAVWETTVSVAQILDMPLPQAEQAVNDYLDLMSIEIMAVPPKAATLAIDAFNRYGKGRHPAKLNFGDCFAYACARYYRQPLLYKAAISPKPISRPREACHGVGAPALPSTLLRTS
jgi:ribonuclease VapC